VAGLRLSGCGLFIDVAIVFAMILPFRMTLFPELEKSATVS
jgi:hypothetical protein